MPEIFYHIDRYQNLARDGEIYPQNDGRGEHPGVRFGAEAPREGLANYGLLGDFWDFSKYFEIFGLKPSLKTGCSWLFKNLFKSALSKTMCIYVNKPNPLG